MIDCKHREAINDVQGYCTYGKHKQLITLNNCTYCQAKPEAYWLDIEPKIPITKKPLRTRCEHLGKVIPPRASCNCWQKDRYVCGAGVNPGVGVRPIVDCETCPKWLERIT